MIEESIKELESDVMTILEAYIDEMGTEQVFHHLIRTSILLLHELSEDNASVKLTFLTILDETFKELLNRGYK